MPLANLCDSLCVNTRRKLKRGKSSTSSSSSLFIDLTAFGGAVCAVVSSSSSSSLFFFFNFFFGKCRRTHREVFLGSRGRGRGRRERAVVEIVPGRIRRFFQNSFFAHDDGSSCVQRSTDPTRPTGEIPLKVFEVSFENIFDSSKTDEKHKNKGLRVSLSSGTVRVFQ